jgi:hypothetical protein
MREVRDSSKKADEAIRKCNEFLRGGNGKQELLAGLLMSSRTPAESEDWPPFKNLCSVQEQER